MPGHVSLFGLNQILVRLFETQLLAKELSAKGLFNKSLLRFALPQYQILR